MRFMGNQLTISKIATGVLIILLVVVQRTPTSFARISPAQQTGGTLTVALSVEPDTFNVYTSTLAVEDVFINAFYDTLFVEGLDSAMHPKLATNYSVSPNGTVWTIDIVHNATFSDGTPLTAEDVKYSYDLLGLSEITYIQVVDNYTLNFNLNAAYWKDYVLRDLFGSYYGKIVPKHIWSKLSDPYTYNDTNPVGSGPWILDTWVRGQYLTIRANKNYWGGAPKLDEVTFDFIPSMDTQVLDLETGVVDMIYVDPSYVSTLLNVQNVKIATIPQLYNEFIAFNLNRYPFGVKEFRHALAYALDSKTLVRQVLFGFGLPGQQGWVTPGDPIFYNPNVTQYPYNVTKANQILDSLGWKEGSDGVRTTTNGTRLEFPFLEASDSATYLRIGEFIQSNFAQIGVKLDLVPTAFKTVISQEMAGTYTIGMFDWFSISVEPTKDLQYMFLPGAFLNVYGYNSTEFNNLFSHYGLASNFDQYRNDIFQMQQVLSDDLPILTYAFSVSICAYRTDKFQGWVVPVISDDPYQGILNWYSLMDLQPVTAATTSENMTQSTTTQATTTAIPNWSWAGVVVVAAVILIAAMMTRRKKQA